MQMHGNTLIFELAKLPKGMRYAYLYSGWRVLQERIDEEGCGAVMCAVAFSKPQSPCGGAGPHSDWEVTL